MTPTGGCPVRRSAASDQTANFSERKPRDSVSAATISTLQVGWVARLFLPHQAGLVAFYVLAVGEMLLPAWAERPGGGLGSPWHPGHISERYGLFTLIVLGECIAAATVAIHSASASGLSAGLLAVAGGAVLLVFSVWWWYF